MKIKNIRKYIAIILVLSICLLFAGCTDVIIEYRINEKNTVSVTYNLEVDTNRMTFSEHALLNDMIYDLKKHWERLGYDNSTSIKGGDTHNAKLQLNMYELCDTREEAFETLFEIMTNELSVLDEVEYTYNQDYYLDDYSFKGKIDISQIIDKDAMTKAYPKYVMEDLQDALDNSSVTVIFDMPVCESKETDDIQSKITSQSLSLSEPNEFSISGIINHNENTRYEQDVIKYNELSSRKFLNIGIITFVIFLLLVLLIILFIIKRKKLRQNNESDIPTNIYE